MYTTKNGTNIKAKDSFSKAFRNRAKDLGLNPDRHSRIGQFDVVTCTKGNGEFELIIGEIFEAQSIEDLQGRISRDSKYYEGYKADRLSQLAHAESLIKGHALEAEVLAAIAAERESFK